MSLGSTKKTTSNQTTSGTSNLSTTPNVPDWAAGPVQNYFSQVGDFGSAIDMNPNLLNTPTNTLQNKSYQDAFNLGGWSAGLDQSNAMATSASNGGGATYTPPTVGNAVKSNGVTVGGTTLGTAQQSALAQAEAAKAAPASSLLDNFAAYRNTGTNDLITSNLAAYDDAAGRNTAAAAAQMARSGAFGGSRSAILESQLMSDQASGRGNLAAQLNYDAFDKQAALAEADAGRRQQTSLFDAGNQQQTNLSNAGWANSNNQFNTGQANDFTKTQAGLDQQTSLAQAQINAQAEQSYAAAQNARLSQQAGLDAQGGMFNVQTGQQNLDRQLAASGLLANNATAAGNNARADLGSQMDVGNSIYGIDQANNASPYTNLAAYQSLLDGYQPFVGQNAVGSETGLSNGTSTEKSSGGLLGKLASAAQIAGTIASFSDRRLKTDIRRVGHTDAGLPIYTYKYKGSDVPQMGVIAQDVEATQPDALGPEVNGFKTVLYGEIR